MNFASLGHAVHALHSIGSKICILFDDDDDALACADLIPGAVSFPSWELLPFEPFYNDTVRNAARFAAIDAVESGKADILVATLPVLFQKIMPAALLEKYTVRVRPKMRCDTVKLSQTLIRSGYERTYETRYQGQFSVRGELIDIFPPTQDLPVRIVFFDDEIEHIRFFNPQTQLTTSDAGACTIYPLREAIYDEMIDMVKLQELDRPVLTLVNTGRYDGMEKDYPLLYDGYRKFTELFSGDWTFLVEGDRSAISIFYERLDTVERLEHEAEHIRDFYWPDVDESTFTRFSIDGSSETVTKLGAVKPTQFGQSLSLWIADGYSVSMYFDNRPQADQFFKQYPEFEGKITPEVAPFSGSYKDSAAKHVAVSHDEMLGRYLNKPNADYKKNASEPLFISDLSDGDYIVHIDYGIGVYRGVINAVIADRSGDYILVEYSGKNKLYVPVEHLEKIEKYVGDSRHVKVNSMNDTLWRRTKSVVKDKIKTFAVDLLKLQAERASITGFTFSPDTEDQISFEKSFIYTETDDQRTATDEIKSDMRSPKVMERLLCGDVGFGKTEVAIRAAFKAVSDGKQVAVLCPTTVLAIQHYNTFRERLADHSVNIAMLSRLVPASEVKEIKKKIIDKTLDIVIGTHKMLSESVQFKDLGLLIIDEEQRFGVYHKESLKYRTKTIDTLILTATPIPRTLYMSLVGVINLSRLETPPANRHPVQTRAIPFDDDLLREIILREMRRKGQVFVIHNRIKDIESIKERIDKITRHKLTTDYVHGQMHAKEIETKLLNFIERKTDIIISTTIIENGIDIPNVNTIIINEADNFGLSQLYQLRGRVGRRETQAYAYLILPPRVSTIAMERINALLNFDHLGAGFEIAMRDLELRGAGNIIGKEQSGYMNMVGYDLYVKLLKEAIAEINDEPILEAKHPALDINVRAFIPDSYIADGARKIMFYKKIYASPDEESLKTIRREMEDRFGVVPEETDLLFRVARLRLLAETCGVSGIEETKNKLIVFFNIDIGINTILHLVESYGEALSFNSTGDFKALLRIDNSRVIDDTEEFLNLIQQMMD